MHSRLRRAGFAGAFCASLPLLMLAVPAPATESLAAESPRPVEELVELDEVKVRGKVVANAVITVENRVFRLYNQLNKDNRYDVHCRDTRSREGLAMLRVCVPEFLTRLAAPSITPAPLAASRQLGFPQCGGMAVSYDPDGNLYRMASCGVGGGFVGFGGMSYPIQSTYIGSAGLPSGAGRSVLPPYAAPQERIDEFKATMTRVINSDPELQDMAAQLAGMYQEMDRIEARYVQLQEQRREAQKAKRAAARERGRDLWPPHPRSR